VFGRREIRKRERGEREVGERGAISHVRFRREIGQRDKMTCYGARTPDTTRTLTR